MVRHCKRARGKHGSSKLTLVSKRICSGFHSKTISSPPSQFELFQLSVLYLFVFVENKGSGSTRLVGV